MLHGNGKLTIREEEFKDLNIYVKDWEKLISRQDDHFDDYFIDPTIKDKIYSYLNYLNPKKIYNDIFGKFPNKKIFVVSVLKNGFYWSKKYITYDGNTNKVLGKGVLENHCISVDKNGFGWIVPKEGKKCYGEIIDVEYEDFLDVEFFYGQCDSKMTEITVKLCDNDKNEEIKVYAYIIKDLFDNVKNKDENCEIEEYTIETQNEKFNPMQHVINQQERYLSMSLDFNLKDSW
jgi:hypothetical protein